MECRSITGNLKSGVGEKSLNQKILSKFSNSGLKFEIAPIPQIPLNNFSKQKISVNQKIFSKIQQHRILGYKKWKYFCHKTMIQHISKIKETFFEVFVTWPTYGLRKLDVDRWSIPDHKKPNEGVNFDEQPPWN